MGKIRINWTFIHVLSLSALCVALIFLKAAWDTTLEVTKTFQSNQGINNHSPYFYEQVYDLFAEKNVSLMINDRPGQHLKIESRKENDIYFITMSLDFEIYFPKGKESAHIAEWVLKMVYESKWNSGELNFNMKDDL